LTFVVMAMWSEHELVKYGTVPWDAPCRTRVTYTRTSVLRLCCAILVILGLTALYVASNELKS